MTNQTISDYYADLQYDEFDETEVITKLHDLSRNIIFKKNDNFSTRFLKTAAIIEKNLPLFQSFCDHVDIITTIIEYLNYYGIKFANNKLGKDEEEEEVIALISTLFDICVESHVQLFLSTLLQNSDLEGSENKIYDQVLCQYNEVIIFEDSDLYIVTKVLTSTLVNNYVFNVIWIQEPLAVKIRPFISKSYLYKIIRIFRSKQELLDSTVSNVQSITSIWSEDIIAAKNLAASLNRDIVFINTFMDIYGGIILLPRAKKLDKCLTLLQDESANAIPDTSTQLLYNLFYDGMWQKPVKNIYWLNEGHLWANATHDDIKKCIGAAEKGAKIWNATSIDSRIQILSKLASTLECNNKHKLASIILDLIKSSHFFENAMKIIYSQNGRLEITVKHKPSGFVTLKAEKLNMLFCQLALALITGNSIIVLCNSVYCSLAPYCDMFSTSGIPPGVINMLSIKNVENVLQDYYINETELLSEENPYIKFTKPKITILPVK